MMAAAVAAAAAAAVFAFEPAAAAAADFFCSFATGHLQFKDTALHSTNVAI